MRYRILRILLLDSLNLTERSSIGSCSSCNSLAKKKSRSRVRALSSSAVIIGKVYIYILYPDWVQGTCVYLIGRFDA